MEVWITLWRNLSAVQFNLEKVKDGNHRLMEAYTMRTNKNLAWLRMVVIACAFVGVLNLLVPTAVAAEKTGRRAYAMDIDPVYVQATIDRWEAYRGRTAARLRRGRRA